MFTESMRESFGRALVDMGDSNHKLVVVDADLSKSTKTEYFKSVFPDRFVDVGIAEQNLVGVSAGLAAAGMNVFASSFAVFETGRAYEIIRNSVCMGKLNVKLCSTHAGLMTGPDGATHQSIEDIAIMRVLPNMRVLVPADAIEAYQMTKYLANSDGPAYMRLVRKDVENILGDDYQFELGKSKVLRDGDDISIIACGPMVSNSIKASDLLRQEGINVRVVNMSTIKPLDTSIIEDCAKNTRAILTIEDHSKIGGLGSAVCEYISEHCPIKVKKIGVPDEFGMSAKAEELYEHFNMTTDDIVDQVRILMGIDF